MDRLEQMKQFSALLLRHERMLATLCLRHSGGDEQWCLDLLQEVRIGLWRRYIAHDSLPAAIPARVWLYWNARSIVSHRHRTSHTELLRLQQWMLDTIAAPDDHAAALVDELAAGLDDDALHLLALIRQGYSTAEIADLTGTTVDAIRSRRTRLIQAMRRQALAHGMMGGDEK